MRLFGLGKPKINIPLEAIAEDFVRSTGIPIVDSPPNPAFCRPKEIIGYGDSKKDVEVAFEHFQGALRSQIPAAVSLPVSVGSRILDAGSYKELRASVSVTGYFLREADYTKLKEPVADEPSTG